MHLSKQQQSGRKQPVQNDQATLGNITGQHLQNPSNGCKIASNIPIPLTEKLLHINSFLTSESANFLILYV